MKTKNNDEKILNLFSQMMQEYPDCLSGLEFIAEAIETGYEEIQNQNIAPAIRVVANRMKKTNKIMTKCFELTKKKCNLKIEKTNQDYIKEIFDEIVKEE